MNNNYNNNYNNNNNINQITPSNTNNVRIYNNNPNNPNNNNNNINRVSQMSIQNSPTLSNTIPIQNPLNTIQSSNRTGNPTYFSVQSNASAVQQQQQFQPIQPSQQFQPIQPSPQQQQFQPIQHSTPQMEQNSTLSTQTSFNNNLTKKEEHLKLLREANNEATFNFTTPKIILDGPKKMRETCCGTTKRKAISLSCLTFFMALMTFFTVRIFDALALIDSEPFITEFSLEDLCSDNYINTRLVGKLYNPSSITTFISKTEATLSLRNGSVLAYVDINPLTVRPGNMSVDISLTVRILEEDVPLINGVIQSWLNGQAINYTLSVPLSANFDASAFLIPFAFDTELEFNRSFSSFGNSNGFEYENEYEASTIKEILLQESSSPDDYILAELAINLWGYKTVSDAYLSATLPPITFGVNIEGEYAAVGKSKEIYYGPWDETTQAYDEIGVIRTDISAGWEHMDGVHTGLITYDNEPSVEIELFVTDNIDHPDFQTSSDCFAQKLLNGLTFTREVNKFEYDEIRRRRYLQLEAENDYFKLDKLLINNINTNGVIKTLLDLDLDGLMENMGVRGLIPPLNVIVEITGAIANTKDRIIDVSLDNGFELLDNQPKVDEISLSIEFTDISSTLRAFDKFISGNTNELTVYVKTDPSTSKTDNNIASALLSALVFEFDLTESNEIKEIRLRERRLKEAIKNDLNKHENNNMNDNNNNNNNRKLEENQNKQLILNVDSSKSLAYLFVNATGFDVFGNTIVEWKEFNARIFAQTKDIYNEIDYKLVSDINIPAYDSSNDFSYIGFNVSIFDNNFNGELLELIVNNYTEYKDVYLQMDASYNNQQKSKNFGGNFKLTRAQDAITDDSNIQANSGLDIFSLKRTELLGLELSTFHTLINFYLDLGDIDAKIYLPKIALGISRCDLPLAASLIVDRWSFETNNQNESIPVLFDFRPENASEVTTIFFDYYKNEIDNRFCLFGHPDADTNFLSYFIGSLGFDFNLAARNVTEEESENSIIADALSTSNSTNFFVDVIDITINSDDSSACTSFSFLIDADAVSSNFTAIGWGDMDMVFKHNKLDNINFLEVLEISVTHGYLGPYTDYAIEQYQAPKNGPEPVNISVCTYADPSVTVTEGVDAVKLSLQAIIDSLDLEIDVGGDYIDRIYKQTQSITAEFGVPTNFLPSFQTINEVEEEIDYEEDVEWFAFKLFEIVEISNNIIQTNFEVNTGDVGIKVTLPKLEFRVGSINDNINELTLVEASIELLDSFGDKNNYALPVDANIEIVDWNELIQFVSDFFITSSAKLIIGATSNTNANFLSRIIPDIKINYTDVEDVDLPTLDQAQNGNQGNGANLNLDLHVTSNDTHLSLDFELLIIDSISTEFRWETFNLDIYNGDPLDISSTKIGHIIIPGNNNFKDKGSIISGMKINVFDDEGVETARKLFDGEDIPFGIDGKVGINPFEAYFVLPKDLVTAVAVGDEDSKDDATSSFSILGISILGGSEPGVDGHLPCIIPGYCDDLAVDRDYMKSQTTGVTIGVSIGFEVTDTPEEDKFLNWNIYLDDDVQATYGANGFTLGHIILREKLVVNSSSSEMHPVISAFVDVDELENIESTVDLIFNSYDTVFTVGGDSTSNYISKLVSAIEQDIEFVGRSLIDEEDDSVSNVGDLTLSLSDTKRDSLKVNIGVEVLYDFDFPILLGDLEVQVYYGHDDGDLIGSHVVTATVVDPILFYYDENFQNLNILAEVHHNDDTEQYRADKLLSQYIWVDIIAVEAKIVITPPSDNPFQYGNNQFTLSTYATIPKGASDSGFIDDFGVDMTGTITSSLGDVHLIANKVIKNTLDWPILVSFFEYEIHLLDDDGVRTGECNGITGQGLYSAINPCSYFFCYGPYDTYTNVDENGRSVKSCEVDDDGNCNEEPHPLKSFMTDPDSGNSVDFIETNGLAQSSLDIDVSIESLARMADEYYGKEMLCANVINGVLWAAMQVDPDGCTDNDSTLEDNLQCTWVSRVYIDLIDYPLMDGDTCGQNSDIQMSADFTSLSSDGVYQFPDLQGTHQLINDDSQQKVRWDTGGRINVKDTFRISMEFKADTRTFCTGAGEAITLIFRRGNDDWAPTSTSQPGLNDGNCGIGGCSKDIYGFNGVGTWNAGIAAAFYGCNSFALLKDGQLDVIKKSTSCAGEEIDNGNYNFVQYTYDANNHRMEVLFKPSSGDDTSNGRKFEFDVNLADLLGDYDQEIDTAWVGIGASSGYWYCSDIYFKNFKVESTRTDSLQTILEEALILPQAGDDGYVIIRARDPEQRIRGMPGDTFDAIIYEGDTSTLASLGKTTTVTDQGDGTYRIDYNILTRGRYRVEVACTSTVAPNDCVNVNQYISVTSGLFIREAADE